MKENLYTIFLDGSLQSSLDFHKERELALLAVEKGFNLQITIDLGLFSKLKKPISSQSQYLSLKLSLEHFQNSFWKEFHLAIVDVCLYKGALDFSQAINADEQIMSNYNDWLKERSLDSQIFNDFYFSLFCRDVAMEYLHLLRVNLPDNLPLSIQLNALEVQHYLKSALLAHPEVFEPFHLKLINSSHLLAKSNIAICLPSSKKVSESDHNGLQEAFEFLSLNKLQYRLIPESTLISEWDLVDYLIVVPHSLDGQGKRKLQGFAAAGGIVVSTGDKIGLDDEISLNLWMQQILDIQP